MIVQTVQKLPSVPVVFSGAGSSLPDNSVANTVSQWTKLFKIESDNLRVKVQGFLRGYDKSFGGNPKSQQKFLSRIEQVYGNCLMLKSAEFGKRAKFSVQLDMLVSDVAPRNSDLENGEQNWLSGVRLTIIKDGPHRKFHNNFELIGYVSHHAMTRMIQRGACHKPEDIRKTLTINWHKISNFEYLTRDLRSNVKRPEDHNWLFPVKSLDNQPLVFVLSLTKRADEDDTQLYDIFVRTVMPRSYLKNHQLPAFDELDDFMERQGHFVNNPELVKAFHRLIALNECV